MASKRSFLLALLASLGALGACTFGAGDYELIGDGVATGGEGGTSTGGGDGLGGAAGASNGACPAGKYDDDGNPDTACVSWTACEPGEYAESAGSAQSNRACAPCPSGEFTSEPNAASCEPYTVCSAGKYRQTAGSPDSDAVCKSCASGTFSASAGATQCTAWNPDPCMRSFSPIEGTATSDAACDGTVFQLDDAGDDGNDSTTDVAVDAMGNVTIVGTTMGFGDPDLDGTLHAFVAKIDWAGAPQWTKEFGTETEDHALGVALDEAGNAYVVGSTHGNFGNPGTPNPEADAYLIKFDPWGEMLWLRQFGSASEDIAEDVAVDPGGTAYVVGSTLGAIHATAVPLGGRDAFLTKCDSEGTLAWHLQFGTDKHDNALAVSLRNGALDVAGTTTGTLGDTGTNKGLMDTFVRRYGLNQNVQWTTQLGTPGNDLVRGVATDSAGLVYVAGSTNGAFPDVTNAGLTDGFLVKLGSTGAPHWTHQFGSIEPDVVAGVVVDSEDSPFVVGSTDGQLDGQDTAGASDVFVRKHDQDGTPLWTHVFGGLQQDAASSATFAAGRIWVGGSTESTLPGFPPPVLEDGFVLSVLP